MNRREFLKALLAVALMPGCTCSAVGRANGATGISPHEGLTETSLRSRRAAAGCLLQAASPGAVRSMFNRFFPSTGNPMLDQMFGNETRILAKTFSVMPGFQFFDDSSGPNAFATREILFPSRGPDGSVLFGLTLMNSELITAPGTRGGPLQLILAHEWGHITQYKHNFRPGMKLELHADFLGGWYIAGRFVNEASSTQNPYERQRVLRDVTYAAKGLYSKGDYQFNSPQHHGTPAQRMQAMLAGMKTFLDRYQAHHDFSFDEAFQRGAELVGL